MNKLQQTVTGEHVRSLTLSVGLLDRLLPRTRGKRYSRIEAYRYLLSTLIDQALGKQTLLGVELDIKPGQVIITDSELSQTWGWHRATVKSFLLELEELSVLTMRRETKFSILTFPDVQKKVAAESALEISSDGQQEMGNGVSLSEKAAQPVSVSEPKKPEQSTSVKSSRNTSSSTASIKSSAQLLQTPSLFDNDDCLINTDETHSETEPTKSGMERGGLTDEGVEQNPAPVGLSQTIFPLDLTAQNSSVSDRTLLPDADEEKTVENPRSKISQTTISPLATTHQMMHNHKFNAGTALFSRPARFGYGCPFGRPTSDRTLLNRQNLQSSGDILTHIRDGPVIRAGLARCTHKP